MNNTITTVVGRFTLGLTALLFASLLQGCASKGQASFGTPGEASDALVSALRANDAARIKQILGPGGIEIVYSGDEVADRRAVTRFVNAYDQRHTFAIDDDGSQTLQIGDTDWPMPIPLVEQRGKWMFDTESGKDEILNRRIGRNELFAVQVCLAIADAQREYALTDHDGDGLPEYAQQFLSDSGKQNGLFWKPRPGEPISPLGPLVAAAAEEGYTSSRSSSGAPSPYHGYCYRMLKSQGPSARGGACDYVVHGKMIGGFAAVASPAEYGNSGIMTFIVNHDGVVYQKDLGPDSQAAGQSMTSFDPGEGWEKVGPTPAPYSP